MEDALCQMCEDGGGGGREDSSPMNSSLRDQCALLCCGPRVPGRGGKCCGLPPWAGSGEQRP